MDEVLNAPSLLRTITNYDDWSYYDFTYIDTSMNYNNSWGQLWLYLHCLDAAMTVHDLHCYELSQPMGSLMIGPTLLCLAWRWHFSIQTTATNVHDHSNEILDYYLLYWWLFFFCLVRIFFEYMYFFSLAKSTS